MRNLYDKLPLYKEDCLPVNSVLVPFCADFSARNFDSSRFYYLHKHIQDIEENHKVFSRFELYVLISLKYAEHLCVKWYYKYLDNCSGYV